MSLERNQAANCFAALDDSPALIVIGPRQCGKSTFAQQIAVRRNLAYLTFDDSATLAAASGDPDGFLAGLSGPVVLDEVQRVPGLFVPLKAAIDRGRRPGRFLLTGSANVLLLPRVCESLAGRMEILNLWPLSQGEIAGVKERFVDWLFDPSAQMPARAESVPPGELCARIARGGFPEMLTRNSAGRQRAWFDSYATAMLQRDVRDLANIEGLTDLPRLMAILAARASSLLNFADLARDSALPQTTLKRYMSLLETLFLIWRLPPWFRNIGKRLVKSPKLMLCDSGLLLHLCGSGAAQLAADPLRLGPALENFAALELLKQAAWSRARPALYHFRTHNREEVDVVLETGAGRVAGVEIKSGHAVKAEDFAGLRLLAEACGKNFTRGAVLYNGAQLVPFAKNLFAVPLAMLWK